ncbi:MAG TPA: UDP-N-acetylmuramoyl-tripeptide--D-alanyl-D-alanine ligase, partial [bacterium (Candidatus Stahlbacteria)]|nr:UDP-N-acetylmuramoyl-tripeptide--D-alanyl-D-alanine ligase [Candidatus Stahlbacteria bacterium]
IGITGTNGKTTTKAIIGSILSRVDPTLVAEKSYNNAIGIPLTILRLKASDRFLVLEFGTNHPGEISSLLRIAVPDIGVLTNIGPGHLEGFGSIDGVKIEKFKLLQAVDPSGAAVYPADLDPSRIRARRITFGPDGEIQGKIISTGEDGTVFEVGGVRFSSQLLGEANVQNCLAAIGVARFLNIEDEAIKAGILDCQPIPGRLMLKRHDGVMLLDDTYNSNPASLREAIRVMSQLEARRKILVLGDMLELGAEGEEIHKELGKEMKGKADLLLTFGELSRFFITGFGDGLHFTDRKRLIQFLNDPFDDRGPVHTIFVYSEYFHIPDEARVAVDTKKSILAIGT